MPAAATILRMLNGSVKGLRPNALAYPSPKALQAIIVSQTYHYVSYRIILLVTFTQ